MSHILYSRRRWIQSVGLGLSAPLFSPLLRSTFAQGAGAAPRRFVIVLAGNGIESANLLSPATQAAIESQGTGSLEGQRYNFHTRYGHSNPIVNRVADLHLAPALSALMVVRTSWTCEIRPRYSTDFPIRLPAVDTRLATVRSAHRRVGAVAPHP